MRILDKIKRHTKSLTSDFCNEWNFSKKLAIVRFFCEIFIILKLKYLANILIDKRDAILTKWIQEEMCCVVEKYKDSKKSENICNDYSVSPIWICWLQGIDNAPEVVKKCVSITKTHSTTHPVNIITWSNVKDYIDIPSYIYDKAIMGKMNLAVFCDYVRVSLLYKYGGLWVDSTIFVSQDFPEEYFQRELMTCNGASTEHPYYIANGRWTTFFIGGHKGNKFFSFIKECFEEYWKNNESAINYLLFDYIIDLGYSTNSYFKRMIDNIPLNNPNRNLLSGRMINGSISELSDCISEDTVIYKLSWKSHYPTIKNGEQTVYSKFLGMKTN